MIHKNVFRKGLGFLIVALLAVTAFLKEPAKLWAYGAVFAVWAVWMLTALLLRSRGNKRVKHVKARKPRRALKPDSCMDTSLILRHVNYRVSAYLQSAYPDATWEWRCKAPEKIATEGGSGRIELFGVPEFNYAEVTIGTQAQISCELLRVVPLSGTQSGEQGETDTHAPTQAVDTRVWYDLQGRAVLEAVVSDLHSRGFSSLTIRENGDICVRQGEQDTVQDRLSNLPARTAWPGLVKLFEKSGFAAQAGNAGIRVSW